MHDYNSNISQRRDGFLLVLSLLLLYNEGEIHFIYYFSPYLYKASLLLYFRCYSFDNVHSSLLLFVDGIKLKHGFAKSLVT